MSKKSIFSWGGKKQSAQPVTSQPVEVANIEDTPSQPIEVTTAETQQSGEVNYNGGDILKGINWFIIQNNFLKKVIFSLGLFLALSLTLNAFFVMRGENVTYFASSPDGKIVELVPLSKPLLSQAGLLGFVSETVTQTLNFDFVHYKNQLNDIRPYFTENAYKSYLSSLEDSGIRNMVVNKRLTVNAVPIANPVITSSGVMNGRFTWRVEFPVKVTYESSKGIEMTQDFLATALVHREATAYTLNGVVIKQLILANYDARMASTK